MSKIVFTSNKGEVLRKLRGNKELAHHALGVFIKSEAKDRSPVITGDLRESIGYTADKNKTIVGATIEYAPYVELGTSKRKPRPYLRPAFEENPEAIRSIVEKYYKG